MRQRIWTATKIGAFLGASLLALNVGAQNWGASENITMPIATTKPAFQTEITYSETPPPIIDSAMINDWHPMLRPTFSGSYLAARFAENNRDWHNAEKYLSRALDHSIGKDVKPSKTLHKLMERNFILSLMNGNFEQALGYAEQITKVFGEGDLTYIISALGQYKDGHYEAALSILNAIDTERFGGYAVPIMKAWALSGHGDDIEDVIKPLQIERFSTDPNYMLQKALIYDINNYSDLANKHYLQALNQGLNLYETLIAANFMERYGDQETALNIYNRLIEKDPHNTHILAALERIEKGITPPNHIKTHNEGMGYTIFSMGHLLFDRDAIESALIYSRISEYLGIERDYLYMLMGDILTLYSHYDAAEQYYRQIKPSDSLYKITQVKRVENFERANFKDRALSLLDSMKSYPAMTIESWIREGNIHQQQANYTQALSAYETAIQELGNDFNAEDWWGLLYARGITQERLGNWPEAEKDLLTALEYSPDNPSLLNFIGYSWLEKNVNLEQAYQMLEKAVRLKPNDGYIIDSYGWAHYKLGNYETAAKWLEKAVKLHPQDPTMNDHLGDAYWQIGRRIEAQYQWVRSKKYSDDQKHKEDIEEKLKFGLAAPYLDPTEALAENKGTLITH